MSLIRVNALRDLQEDLRWPLLADEFFADIGVIDYHTAELETQVARMLSPFNEVDGKCGVAVVVMPITATDRFTDGGAGHPLFVRVTFLVLEVPLINMGEAGTGKSAIAICERIRQVMKHYCLGGFAEPLVPADPTFEVGEDPIAPVVWQVNFETFAGVDQALAKPSRVRFDYSDVTGEMTLSCATPDVTIYYTLDGSFPFTGAREANPSAVVYTGPIIMEGEWVIRAAAFAPGYRPGDVTLKRSTDIAAMDGAGNSIGGLN